MNRQQRDYRLVYADGTIGPPITRREAEEGWWWPRVAEIVHVERRRPSAFAIERGEQQARARRKAKAAG